MTKNGQSKNKVIALTGGIGSGKSQALKILEQAGETVLSCDSITAELYNRADVMAWLVQKFPDCIMDDGITPDKKKISSVVFANKSKLAQLTDFLTPLVLDECLKRAKAFNKRVFVEVPLLFEQKAQNFFDGVIIVTRDRTERIKSVMARNNLTEQQVLERISSQFDYDSADLSTNDGSLEQLKDNLLTTINSLY